ncbi:MAG: sigma factor-like helix-turn-helix DNA-binding protein, partial [bacterium]
MAEARSQSESLHSNTAPQVHDDASMFSLYSFSSKKPGKVMNVGLGNGFELEWKASPYTTDPYEIKGPRSGDVRVIKKPASEITEYAISMESGVESERFLLVSCLQLLWNGTQLTYGAEYAGGDGYGEESMRILEAVPSLRKSKGVVPRKQDEVVGIRILSYAKYVHLHCGNFEPFDARWEADTAYRLRSINKDGAIGLESFSGKWVWLNVYAGNRLLDAGELANLQVPNKRLLEKAMPVLEGMDAVEQRSHIEAVLNTLTENEREVIEQRFGLKDGYARTLEEVGRQLEVTPARIKQIEAKTLRKMRHPTRIRKFKDFINLPEEPNPSRSEPEKSATSDLDPASEGVSTLISEHEADVLSRELGLEDLLKDLEDGKNADE